MTNNRAVIYHLVNSFGKTPEEAAQIVSDNQTFVDREKGLFTHPSKVAPRLMVRQGFGHQAFRR